MEQRRAAGQSVSGTQGARRLYSTKRRALVALRYAVARRCAVELVKIDKMIAECGEVQPV